MGKRRHRPPEELMMVPFLDILCSLIGVLILIIVTLCVTQMQRVNGRTEEEIRRAEEHLRLLKKLKEDQKLNTDTRPKVEALEKLKPKLAEQEERKAKLRTLLSNSKEIQQQESEREMKLLKELDQLNLEINGLKTQPDPLQKEIAALNLEIQKRKPPENKAPSVIVQPGGSGLAKGSKVFCVEATGGRLTFYYDAQNKATVSAAPDVLAADEPFNKYLTSVKAVEGSKLLFLLRDDGMGAYNNGAGWAQANHGFQVSQVTKLLIPGRGEIDLRMFNDFLGSIPAPPKPEKPATPPAPAPPAATPPKPPTPPGATAPPVNPPAANPPAPGAPPKPAPAAPSAPPAPQKPG
jgi:biopolymer transport protein ExbD